MSEKLKPCPFCGSEAKLLKGPLFGSDSEIENCHIECSNEECTMGNPDALYDIDSKEALIKDWNTRQPPKTQIPKATKLKPKDYGEYEEDIPLHPTVEQWERITGEKLKDDDSVWISSYYADWPEIVLGTYKEYKTHLRGGYWYGQLVEYVVVAIPGQGKPPADWSPE